VTQIRYEIELGIKENDDAEETHSREKARSKYACHDFCYITTTTMSCVLEEKAKIDPAGP